MQAVKERTVVLDFPHLNVSIEGLVATVEIDRPPHNFFSLALIRSLADAFSALDEDDNVRSTVLCSKGKSFCGGADLSSERSPTEAPGDLYREAVRLFSNRKPVVGAIQGAAIGGGLGLALFPDFRVAVPEARFSANFARLGFHQGFGLSATLPHLVGQQMALDMLLTGRRVCGDEALASGLCDRLTTLERLRNDSRALALEIAHSAPLAVISIRATMRGDLAQRVQRATEHELAEQSRLRETDDFAEGVRAMSGRRLPNFVGR